MPVLEIDKEFFNPKFFDFWEALDSDQRFISNMGGSGSGKSYSITQAWILKLLESKRKLLVLRQTSATLNDSCIALFKDILNDWNIPFKLNKSEKIITFNNGSEILFKGLDNVEKLKSISGLWSIWVEEGTELEQDFEGNCPTFDQINARLRGLQAVGGKIVISFNPVSESNWVYLYFHSKVAKYTDVVHIHSTYKDNKFLDEEYGNQLETFARTNPLFYEIYCLGNFGFISTGNEVLPHFKVSNHVNSVEYNPEQDLIISWDENVVPHLTLIVAQLSGNNLKVIEEICIKGASLEEVCKAFNKKYKGHTGRVIVTGDATSRKEDAKLEKGYNFYRLVEKYLREEFRFIDTRVPKSNESVFMRSQWINMLLFDDDLKVRIDKSCKGAIEDLQSCQWDSSGTKIDKERKTVTNEFGVKSSMETRGHHLDAFAYLLLTVWRDKYEEYKRGGKIVRKFDKSLRNKGFANNGF